MSLESKLDFLFRRGNNIGVKVFAQNCVGTVGILWWYIIAGVLLVVWLAAQIIRICLWRRKDLTVIRALVKLQKEATNETPADTFSRVVAYTECLRVPNRFIWLLYRYVVSHRDFLSIAPYLSSREYRKVAGRPVILPFSIVAILVLAFVALISVLTEPVIMLWPLGIILGVHIIAGVTVFILNIKTKDFRAKVFMDLQSGATVFFMPLNVVYDDFARIVSAFANLTPAKRNRIRKQIESAGCIFRPDVESMPKPVTEPAVDIEVSVYEVPASEQVRKLVENEISATDEHVEQVLRAAASQPALDTNIVQLLEQIKEELKQVIHEEIKSKTTKSSSTKKTAAGKGMMRHRPKVRARSSK